MDAAGGVGYGNPLVREVEMVENDVMEGYISPRRAKEDYGVVVDSQTMKVNLDATKKLRASLEKA